MRKIPVVCVLFCLLTAWCPGTIWGGGMGESSAPADPADWAGNAVPYQSSTRNLSGVGQEDSPAPAGSAAIPTTGADWAGNAAPSSSPDTVGPADTVRSIGAETRDEIAWRKEWVGWLNECDNYVADYIKNTPLPTYLVYSVELEKGEIDWDRETRALSFRIALYPDKNWAAPIQRAVNKAYTGLAATGRASAWGLKWPGLIVAGGESPAKAEVNRTYLAAVELVNEQGQVIGTQSVSLTAGWKTRIDSQYTGHAGVISAGDYAFPRVAAASTQTAMTVTIPYVDAHKITDRMSVRIARLNGRSAETAAQENAVHIMTEADYARFFEQQLNMVSVRGGTFMMGGPDKDEQPHHKETVAPLYMGKYEVTEGEYNVFLRATGRRGADSHRSDDWPVDSATWLDAIKYCNWLSEMTGRRPAYTINREDARFSGSPEDVTWNRNADGYRLPTEAEWEYVCRAGTTTAYSFGNSISENQANYDRQGKGYFRGKMVGSFVPNPWGFYDMHGNVSEWCWDYKEAWPSGAERAVRGGDYRTPGVYLRSAYRGWSNPKSSAGFRIAAPAKTIRSF
ncbi:hypothetical protein FACS1894109_04030 [Spirochaetia bacterium]|nr:hypothetical protein FACS1894109_04030 [Spirochaetia bacterium]